MNRLSPALLAAALASAIVPMPRLARAQSTRPSAAHEGPPRLRRISIASLVPRGSGVTAGMKSPPMPMSRSSASRAAA